MQKLMQDAQRDHEAQMAELKVELDAELQGMAERGTADAPPVFYERTREDFDMIREHVINDAEKRIKRAWQRDMAVERAAGEAISRTVEQIVRAESLDDPTEIQATLRELLGFDDSELLEDHARFAAENRAFMAAELRRIDEIWALVKCYNDAVLDIRNAIREGERERALAVVTSFVARPAIAP